MGAFEMSIVINCPVEEVFSFLSNLENEVKWRREWIDARDTSGGPLGVGATFLLVSKFLGRRVEVEYEVTEYEPSRLTAWKAVSGPLPLTFRRTFERVEGGTRVTIRYDGEMRGFFKLTEPLIVSMGKRQLKGDIPKLKKVMESGAS
jgi:uncharacterized membrane protein